MTYNIYDYEDANLFPCSTNLQGNEVHGAYLGGVWFGGFKKGNDGKGVIPFLCPRFSFWFPFHYPFMNPTTPWSKWASILERKLWATAVDLDS